MPETQRPVIRILDLPGFADMEAKTRIYYTPNQPTPPEFDKVVLELSKATFGITGSDVAEAHELIDNTDDDDLTDEAIEYYDGIRLVDRSDDDAHEVLKELGLDFSDERGHPLRLTRFFKFQAFAAATGLCGTMPDMEAASVKRLEANLADEAKQFMERGRRR